MAVSGQAPGRPRAVALNIRLSCGLRSPSQPIAAHRGPAVLRDADGLPERDPQGERVVDDAFPLRFDARPLPPRRCRSAGAERRC